MFHPGPGLLDLHLDGGEKKEKEYEQEVEEV